MRLDGRSQAATRGARVADTLRDRSDQPHELNRTTLIRAKAKMVRMGWCAEGKVPALLGS
jgi:hypothetical protein